MDHCSPLSSSVSAMLCLSRVILFLVFVTLAFSFEIQLRLLVLTTPATSQSVQDVLDSRGVPRDTVILPTSQPFSLLENGIPKYMGIIRTDPSDLTLEQEAQVRSLTH